MVVISGRCVAVWEAEGYYKLGALSVHTETCAFPRLPNLDRAHIHEFT